MKKISVIIPFLNEEENIPQLCRTLDVFFSSYKSAEAEVIFVDDGSYDNSVDVLKQQPYKNYKAKIVKLSRNFGSINALYAGLTKTEGDYVVFLYADLQDPVELISMLYEKILEGYEIVWAQRKSVDTDNSRFFSRLYAWLMKRYAVKNFPSNGFDVAMFTRKVRNELIKNIEGNSSIFLHLLSLGFRQGYVLYDKRKRTLGKSKWNLSKKFKLVIDSFVAYSYLPIRLVTVAGIIFSVMGFLYSIFIFFYKLMGGKIAHGLSTIVIILLLGFGITNISLGIIAEYLWRTLDVSRRRPPFIIDEVIELNINEQ
ncbi:MAG: glycosyltransferase family 2 protein [Bacteroidia bacterium]|nr:glycosyltransferase family 2 protein [Bacteroidia bacterium]